MKKVQIYATQLTILLYIFFYLKIILLQLK